MGLLDQYFDPETMAAVKQLGQPSEEQQAQAKRNAILNMGLSMMANNYGPRQGAFARSVGAGGLSGMEAYQNTLDEAQKSQMQNIQMAMALGKMKKDQEQQARLNTLSDNLGKALTPQTQDVVTGYKLNAAPDSSGVRFQMVGNNGQDDMAKTALFLQDKIAKGYKPSADEVLFLDQVKSRIQPVTQQVQSTPNLENTLRTLGIQYGVQSPEIGKLLLSGAEQFKPRTVQAGSYQQDPVSGRMSYVGDPSKGLTVGPDGSVQTMPGAVNALSTLAGAQKRAEAEAAGYDPTKRAQSLYETGVDPLMLNGAGPVSVNGLPKKLSDAQVDSVTKPDAVQQRMGAISAFDKTIRTAQNLMEHPGLNGSVGLRGQIPALPGTDSANFTAELDTLKSQTFLPMVQQLKGMGALSNAEGEKLTSAIGALDRKMSAEAFRKSLGTVIKDLEDAKARASYTGLGGMPDLQSLAAEELKRRGK